jgi:hypothetical protein
MMSLVGRKHHRSKAASDIHCQDTGQIYEWVPAVKWAFRSLRGASPISNTCRY